MVFSVRENMPLSEDQI